MFAVWEFRVSYTRISMPITYACRGTIIYLKTERDTRTHTETQYIHCWALKTRRDDRDTRFTESKKIQRPCRNVTLISHGDDCRVDERNKRKSFERDKIPIRRVNYCHDSRVISSYYDQIESLLIIQ